MQKLNRSNLWSLEQYSEKRPAFRAEVIAAGDVFLVPEFEVPQVVFLNEAEKALAGGGGGFLMPSGREFGLKGGDF